MNLCFVVGQQVLARQNALEIELFLVIFVLNSRRVEVAFCGQLATRFFPLFLCFFSMTFFPPS